MNSNNIISAWSRNASRRNFIDMHISADDDRFMVDFDAKTYVEMLSKSQIEATVLYAHSHAGYCYYPTQIGQIHPGLKGRDLVGEVIELCQKAGIHVVLYYSLIFDTLAYRTHPDWRICDAQGKPAAEASRFGVCCPNSPYREYIQSIATEICERYDFGGIRFDMTFWPRVCYCSYCQERFNQEVGGDLPTTINWENPKWVAFQRGRERWLAEFAGLATKTVRKHKPNASVEHQASTYPMTWHMGVTTALAQHNDFLQGDFYGDSLQGSFVRKLLVGLSANSPIGFETSIGVDLANYAVLKSEALLHCKAAAALTDGTAFIMIDSIEPDGKLRPQVYEREGRVFEIMKTYQKYLDGERLEDAAIYFSTESKFDPADNHHFVDDPNSSPRMPHLEAALGACKAMLDCHIPFGVLTRKNLENLKRYKVIILPNVLMLDEIEANALREYVRMGGCLYASRYSSLQMTDGSRRGNFLLADVFGISHAGETKEQFTYIAPTSQGQILFEDYTYVYPMGFPGKQVLVTQQTGAEVLGEVVIPYTDPADPHHFASIHNNPPGIWTGNPALVLNRFGLGKCIYSSIDLEQYEFSRDLFNNLIQFLVGPYSIETNAPKSVEITVYNQAETSRFNLRFLNFQKELPNIPVDDIHIQLRIQDKSPKQVSLLPDRSPLPFQVKKEDGGITLDFSLPRLETFLMVEVVY